MSGGGLIPRLVGGVGGALQNDDDVAPSQNSHGHRGGGLAGLIPRLVGDLGVAISNVATAVKKDFETNDQLAMFAVDEHNKKENAWLMLVRVVKAEEHIDVDGSSRQHLLTLEVFDALKRKTYEAKVLTKPGSDFKELQEFKLVVDSPDAAAPAPPSPRHSHHADDDDVAPKL